MVVGLLNSFLLNISLLFSSPTWRFSAGRTGQAKAMVNNSRLSEIKKNVNKATIYTIVEITKQDISGSINST